MLLLVTKLATVTRLRSRGQFGTLPHISEKYVIREVDGFEGEVADGVLGTGLVGS